MAHTKIMGVFAHEFGFDSLQDFLDAGLNHHHYPSPELGRCQASVGIS
jgi:hypothetical protein